MSSLNKVIEYGRLTRDPELKTFPNGGAVCKLGLAVNERRKNTQNGEWEDDPMFIDVEIFDHGNTKGATNASKYLVKGARVLVEGKLVLERWDDRTTGQKRSKHKIVAFSLVYVDMNKDGGEGGDPSAPTNVAPAENSEEIPF